MIESAPSDQRSLRRFSMQLPVQLTAPVGEFMAVTKDVSAQGIYIHIDSDLAEKALIEFMITLPPEIAMTQSIRVRCAGKVVRIDKESPGRIGIAAMIDHYQFLDNEQR